MNYQIEMDQEQSYADEDTKIRITGKAGAHLVLELETEDLYSVNGDIRVMDVGTRWACKIPVKLDEQGKATLTAEVFTKLKVIESKSSSLEQDLSRIPENRSYHITMHLLSEGDVVASITHERAFCTDEVISREINKDQLVGRFFVRKDVKKQCPVMIVVSGSDGRIEKAQAIAQCFARRGIASLAVGYFGLSHLPADLTEIPMEYLKHAITYVKEQPETDETRIGIYGRSKGGEMVLVAASLFHELRCVVANTPSCYIQEGIIGGKRTSGHSSWSYQGRELPYVRATKLSLIRLVYGMMKKDVFTFRRFYQEVTWKKGKPKNVNACIRLDQTEAHYLLLSSDTDGIWPSDLYANEAEQQLRHAGKEKQCRNVIYHRSGHMLTIPYQPIPNCREYGGELAAGVAATIEAWNETIDFIKKN